MLIFRIICAVMVAWAINLVLARPEAVVLVTEVPQMVYIGPMMIMSGTSATNAAASGRARTRLIAQATMTAHITRKTSIRPPSFPHGGTICA